MRVMSAHLTDPFLLGELLPGFEYSDREAAAKNIMSGYAWTFWDNEEPIAVMGAVQLHDKCVSVWSVMAKDIKKHPMFLHKNMLKIIDELLGQFDRLQSMVDVGNDVAFKHNLAMGFLYEGTLRKSGYHGQDQVIFGLVRGNDGC